MKNPGIVLNFFLGLSVMELKLMGITSFFFGVIHLEIFNNVKAKTICSVLPLSIYFFKNINFEGNPDFDETKESLTSKGLPHMYLVNNNLHVLIYFTVNNVPFFFRRVKIILNVFLINLTSQLG
jgi:hypothetical protein